MPAPAGTMGAVTARPTYALGELGPADLAGLGTRVHALQAEPDSLRIRVGQTVSFGELRVDALDFRGRRLGRLRIFDRGTTGNGAIAIPDAGEFVGRREGIDTLLLSYPETIWRGQPHARPRTAVIVHVVR